MSVDRCAHCSRQVDTDFDLDCYDEEGQCMCEPCRDRYGEDEILHSCPERPTTISEYLTAKGRS